MALSNYMGGQGWSGHKAPSSDQTNPDNDPEIAASQERLRQYAALTKDQLTNPRVVGKMTTGSGDDQGSEDIIQYDSPLGPVTLAGGVFRTAEKFWWQPGLAETMELRFGEDGKIAEAKPRDSKYSLGEQVGDFAGNLVTMGASMLAMYGAAYGLGSTVGTGVGTTGTTATGTTATTQPGVLSSAASGGGSSTAGMGGGGLKVGGAGSAAGMGGSGVTTTAAGGGTLTAGGVVPAAGAATGAGAASVPAASWWGSLLEGGKAALSNGQVVGGIISGVGQGISSYMSNEAADDRAQEERNWRSEEADKERKYKARNMNIENMPSIRWNRNG